LFNPETWGAYLLNGEVFVKCTKANPQASYPDYGCSFETFTNDELLELETLGPLARVAPGEWIEHEEKWGLYRNAAPAPMTDEALDAAIAPLVQATRLQLSHCSPGD
jgi:hypothetical protein